MINFGRGSRLGVVLILLAVAGVAVYTKTNFLGPSAHREVSAAGKAVCEGAPSPGAFETNGQVFLVGGVGIDHPAILASRDDGFQELAIRDRKLASDLLLCGGTTPIQSVECPGYFDEQTATEFEELLPLDRDSLGEFADDLEQSLANGAARSDRVFTRDVDRGGRTLEVPSMQFTVQLMRVSTGEKLGETVTTLGGECPDTLTERDLFGARPGRLSVDPELTAEAVLELTGFSLG